MPGLSTLALAFDFDAALGSSAAYSPGEMRFLLLLATVALAPSKLAPCTLHVAGG
jgi:hypothetical protein